jgi:hypothetical protein
LDARLTTLLCKIYWIRNRKKKNRCNLTESSKEGYGSRMAVLPMMMMMMHKQEAAYENPRRGFCILFVEDEQ